MTAPPVLDRRPSPGATASGRAASAVRERRRFRGALLLLGMTLVAPGSAQLVAGSERGRRVGRVALLTAAGLAVLALLLAWRMSPEALAGWFVRSWVLTLVRVLAVLVAGAWIVLLVDAWRLGRPPTLTRRHRLAMVAATVAAALAVSVPLGYAAHYAQIARDDVLALFPQGDAAAAADGRLNVLLLGGDAAEDRPGVRTDSINLASVDVATGRTLLVSLPRNLQHAAFPDGTAMHDRFPDGFRSDRPDDPARLLNAVYGYGVEHPDLFPGATDPGAAAVGQAVSGTTGLPVHYYVLVNMLGFRDLVDALGGVTVRVRERVPYEVGGEPVTIEPGEQHLDGRQVMIFTRSRTGSSDYSRMGRQRCVIGALLRQADPLTVLRRFQAIAATAKGLMSTDIPQSTLPDMVSLAGQAKDEKVRTLALVPPLVRTADPDIGRIHDEVQEAIAASRSDTGPAAPKAAPTGAAQGSAAPSAASGAAATPGSKARASAAPSSSSPTASLDAGC